MKLYSIAVFSHIIYITYSSETNTILEEDALNNYNQVHQDETTENTCLLRQSEEKNPNNASVIPNGVLVDSSPIEITKSFDLHPSV